MAACPVHPELLEIARAMAAAGGELLLVGGAVRDWLRGGESSKDLDLEVRGLELEPLEALLGRFGPVHAVGRSFGVFKLALPWGGLDIALPRRENKTGRGHKGFIATPDPWMPFAEAASRRDFTINAMGYGLLSGQLLDPFGGQRDLEQGVLRHVGPAFVEDPLRVLRAVQFCARFELTIHPETVALCRTLDLAELPRERLFEEFKKLLLEARQPSLGLRALAQLGALRFFPELAALVGTPQDPEWHPEGDVWDHTLLVVDEAVRVKTGDERADLALLFGALCHDFGKPLTTVFSDGRWRSPGHESQGVAPTQRFMERLTADRALLEQVLCYVREHLAPAHLYKARHEVKDGAIRRLALRVNIPDLVRFASADHFGRTLPEAQARQFPAGDWLLARAANLAVATAAPTPLVMGRHLMALGFAPGPEMGAVLKRLFELQLDGVLTSQEQALEWVRGRHVR